MHNSPRGPGAFSFYGGGVTVIRVGIAGITGYTGIELVRLLQHHPEARVVLGTSEQSAGQSLAGVHPHLGLDPDLPLAPLDPHLLAENCDVVFLALPHGVAIDAAPVLLAAGCQVIDLGADFRLKDGDAYRAWYKHDPAPADLLAQAAYGLPELFGDQIASASLVANPGCYPTSCALAAAPLLVAGAVETRGIIFDSASGVSGAGRGVSLGVHFSEVNENFKAYNVAGMHRHTPEIEQSITWLTARGSSGPSAENGGAVQEAPAPIRVTFTPHLVPMTRGILTTAYFQLRQPLTTAQAVEMFRDFYTGEPFVRVRPAGDLPQTKQVLGSNFCDIGVAVDERTGRVIVVAAIDNLVKGASGQAIQNMNLLRGLPETTGLTGLPLYP